MKYKTLLVLVVLLISCSTDKNKNDSYIGNLNGNVKTVTETSRETIDEFW